MAFAARIWPFPPRLGATYVLLRRELADPIPEPALAEGMRIVDADSARVERIADLAATRRREAVLRSSMAGHVCTCALSRDQIAGFGWATEDAGYLFYGEEEECRVYPLAPGEVFTYDLHVLTPFRERGLGFAIKCHQLRRQSTEGRVRSWSLVDCWNLPSLRLQWRLGARPERLVHLYALGRARWFTLGPRGKQGSLARWYNRVGGRSDMPSRSPGSAR